MSREISKVCSGKSFHARRFIPHTNGLRPALRPQEEVVQVNIWGGLSGGNFPGKFIQGNVQKKCREGIMKCLVKHRGRGEKCL